LATLVPTLLALDAVLVDPISVSRASARILPDGDVVEAGLDLRLDIALEQFSQLIAVAGQVVRT
jgi:hypothetical protein